MDWAREATKDKYLMLIMSGFLLWAYIHTHDAVIQTLMVTSVGAFLALVKASTSSVTQTGSPAVTNVENKDTKQSVIETK